MKLSRRRAWAIGLVSFAVLIAAGYLFRTQLALTGFDLFLKDRVEKELEGSYRPIDRGDAQVKPTPVERERQEPFTILLLEIGRASCRERV